MKQNKKSFCKIKSRKDESLKGNSALTVSIHDERGKRLPARCILRSAAGSFVDPTGRGIPEGESPVAGGFYVAGAFSCSMPSGMCALTVEAGHHLLPFSKEIALEPGRRYTATITLVKWFRPKDEKWFGGDCHFHIWHGGAYLPVRTQNKDGGYDYEYMKLATQAEGLDYAIGGSITDRKSHAGANRQARRLSDRNFIFRPANEQSAIWAGHANPLGYNDYIEPSLLLNRPLPFLHLRKKLEKKSAILNYTHPACFPCLNWLSAIEVFSHAALGLTGGLFDVGTNTMNFNSPFSPARRELQIRELFFLWSVGMKLAASATSDAFLEQGLRPGKHRTYVKAGNFSCEKIVAAMRKGHTVASSGPVFALVKADDKYLPGDEIEPGPHTLSIEAHARSGLARIELIVDGSVEKVFTPRARRDFRKDGIKINLEPGSWVTILARDTEGGLSLPTALFAESQHESRGDFSFLSISDADRAIRASGDFFLHLIATVGESIIKEAVIFRNNKTILKVSSDKGNNIPSSGVPLSRKKGYQKEPGYETGWVFYPSYTWARHIQLSLKVRKPGLYSARVKLADGNVIDAGGVSYPKPPSATAGVLQFVGRCARFWLETFGEECRGMPRAAEYEIDACVYSLISFKKSAYVFDRIGPQARRADFLPPQWVKSLRL